MKDKVLSEVTKHYLESPDFNGIPMLQLIVQTGADWSEVKPTLAELVKEEFVGLLFSEFEPNTHILRTGFPDSVTQIDKLATADLIHTCAYPRPKHLETVINKNDYQDEPYKLPMALGEPQLSYRAFDLSILELYRNDPRYYYTNDDINGTISVKGDFDEPSTLSENDQILLETFGFAYDEDMNRAVATFLRYLADLSSEHQKLWQVKQLGDGYKLHPDYYRNSIIGDWGEKVPIFSAFVNELYIINQMSVAMERPPLFRNDFGKYGEERPQEFGFLVRPTLKEFNDFVHLLDKIVSDNINKKFFQNEIPYETETERSDGKIVVQPKGTLQLFDEWLRKYFRCSDWAAWEESIKAIRKVRKLRQEPAHAINENIFDQKYSKISENSLWKSMRP
ncbi:MAG: AAA family ATPase [Acidobacteriota bacterium]